ncbi:MAG: alpha-ketoglutarate-dependent dioxygenase AlkB [Rhodospirillales bacterium]|nr:alpha-ketoglutarate-dependent dioxygenase AlkB [Alphaproteobacteria bacterium]MCB9986821.1 alpha-ketoglutarate-dependent dioxygenase AlkB [Rhodospirillales bacterium]USO08585.1 MAG: alpha-ketoglutarate-dependent dioxygenase AlkB [Rhodospirillales bacterium]
MTNLLFKLEKEPIPAIDGLHYFPDFLAAEEQIRFIENIDQNSWLNDLKRRVQHYGYKYDYKARGVSRDAYIGPLPGWLKPIAQRLYEQGHFSAVPDQIIVNEYEPGQGISAHVDCIPCFGKTIASLSLGSGAMMQFQNIQTGQKAELYLEEGSLVVLSGPARYEWMHAIPARKSDTVGGFKVERGRRLSLTFRTMITV